jgi:hypothetical protein
MGVAVSFVMLSVDAQKTRPDARFDEARSREEAVGFIRLRFAA